MYKNKLMIIQYIYVYVSNFSNFVVALLKSKQFIKKIY